MTAEPSLGGRLFAVENNRSCYDAELAKRRVLKLHTWALPRWLTLDGFLAAAPMDRAFVHSGQGGGDGRLLVDVSDFDACELDAEAGHLLVIADPAYVVLSHFLADVAADQTLSIREGPKVFSADLDLKLARLESYLRAHSDCNLLCRSLIALANRAGSRVDPAASASDVAKAILAERFSFVGIVERLPESLFFMFDLLGWRQAPQFSSTRDFRRDAMTPRLEELPLSLRRALEAATAKDRLVYESVREELEHRYAEAEFSDSFLAFRQQSAFMSPFPMPMELVWVEDRIAQMRRDIESQSSMSRLQIDGLTASLEQSQRAYASLLKQHLVATGVLQETEDS